ncbi:solute carrier family 49 member A3-like isoform X2 [Penaeus japonicus]|uniref:solute carrier family 49 member A3-like isoform X2 n=1 Tax=Penaeus japonicus TaxID=27405 RepID=UPI001C712E34|nr:solute carrier family 49 member A3-like isoform X2 [Penaeus japonicus]
MSSETEATSAVAAMGVPNKTPEGSRESSSVGGKEDAERTQYVVYPRRWAVLVTVALLNISNAALWINIAPVAYTVASYYKRQLWEINWFSLVFLFVSIPFCFVSTFSVNRLGLRAAIHIGAGLNCIGGLLRAFGSSGAIGNLDVEFAISLTGQTIAGMAQSFLLFIPTKVSQLWFPEGTRAVATTIISLSNPLGIVVAQVATPLIVSAEGDFPTLNYVFGALAVLTEVITIVCVTSSKPATPPSQSAARGEVRRASYLQQLKTTFTCLPYLHLLASLGCGVALFSSLATVTQQLLCPLGYSDMFMVPGQPELVATFTGLFGFFGVGAYPIGLELAVEATYPVEESISTAFIFMSGQFQGVLIIALVTLLGREQKPQYEDIENCSKTGNSDIEPKDYTVSLMVIMTYLAVIVSIMILFFDTPYKRLEAERLTPDPTAATNNTASSSSSSHGSVSPRSSASSFHSLTESGRALRGGGGGGGGGRREEERVEDQGDCGGQDEVERSRL